MEQKTKPWKCLNPECQRPLGYVYRNSRRIRKLRVGNVTLTGNGEVDCPACGWTRYWEPGEEALEDLLANMKIMLQSH